VVAREAFQVALLQVGEAFAHPTPVQRSPVARRGGISEPTTVQLARYALLPRGTEPEVARLKLERLSLDEDRRSIDPHHPPQLTRQLSMVARVWAASPVRVYTSNT
jgi:hypothetical protein